MPPRLTVGWLNRIGPVEPQNRPEVGPWFWWIDVAQTGDVPRFAMGSFWAAPGAAAFPD